MLGRKQYQGVLGKGINISKQEEQAIKDALKEIDREAKDLQDVHMHLRDLEERVYSGDRLLVEARRNLEANQPVDWKQMALILNTLKVNKTYLDSLLKHLRNDRKIAQHVEYLVGRADFFAQEIEKMIIDAGESPDIVSRS